MSADPGTAAAHGALTKARHYAQHCPLFEAGVFTSVYGRDLSRAHRQLHLKPGLNSDGSPSTPMQAGVISQGRLAGHLVLWMAEPITPG